MLAIFILFYITSHAEVCVCVFMCSQYANFMFFIFNGYIYEPEFLLSFQDEHFKLNRK
jgi:hypothetical protein